MRKIPFLLMGAGALAACGKDRPNFLIIQCDQLATRAIGEYGGLEGHSEVMDSLARNGVVFDNAYTACALSQPSRTALLTGLLPHQTGVRSNSGKWKNSDVDPSLPTLGSLFSDAGYRAVHFGKRHDCGALRGFTHKEPVQIRYQDPQVPLNPDSFKDAGTCADAVEFLSAPGKDPFICMVDFQNPHNICGYVGFAQGLRDVADTAGLPPLPDNFEIDDWSALPIPIQYLCCNHRRLEQAAHWSPENYRQYIAAYMRYVEIVCAQIRSVLNALESTPAGRNTIVVLLADHGDAMASHRMVTKQTDFHEESVKVPLIFCGPGVHGRGKHLTQLVQTSTDFIPTLCGLAGIDAPSSLRGISQAPSILGRRQKENHAFVVSQWHSEYDRIVSPGRMIRLEEGFKYTHYLEGNGEELYDLNADPGEKHNLAGDPASAELLQRCRSILEDYLSASGDDYRSLSISVDPAYRRHAPGYPSHIDGYNLWNFCNPSAAPVDGNL
ncbi:MAG: sulfatase-like hydrolase/transferase [Bacteroidales bacterium]|nr:sulfatase-like hydrolase/transferase [Bacteroidales bacterium]